MSSRRGNSKHRCTDCPTAQAVADLESHRLHDLGQWAELRSDLMRNEDRHREHMHLLTEELAGLRGLIGELIDKVTDLEEGLRGIA